MTARFRPHELTDDRDSPFATVWGTNYYLSGIRATWWGSVAISPSRWSASDLAVGGDNRTRALWTNSDGRAALWTLNAGGGFEVNNTYGPYSGWSARAITVDANNKTRVLWTNTNGQAAIWIVAPGDQSTGGGTLESNLTFGPYAGWSAGCIAVGLDNLTRVMWRNTDGRAALWVLDAAGNFLVNNSYGPY